MTALYLALITFAAAWLGKVTAEVWMETRRQIAADRAAAKRRHPSGSNVRLAEKRGA